jgi:hypothetical protein
LDSLADSLRKCLLINQISIFIETQSYTPRKEMSIKKLIFSLQSKEGCESIRGGSANWERGDGCRFRVA